jgi:hypothetical protein
VRIVAAIALLLSLWLPAQRLPAHEANPMTMKELDELLRQRIPSGASRASVIEFLDERRIENSGPALKHVVHAIVRDVSGNFLVRKSVEMEFRFDDRELLEKYTLKEVHTGP